MHHRFARTATTLTAISALVLLAGGCQSNGGPDDISGRYIAVLSDADLSATAFADGNLARPSADSQDAMTIIALPITPEPAPGTEVWETKFAQAPVSNSVMGPPAALAVNPAGNFAVVAETFGPAPAGATKLADLPSGEYVIPVDLTDPMNPKVLERVKVGKGPQSVDISPDGGLLAVGTKNPGNQIVIAPINNGEIGKPLGWPLMGLEDDRVAATCVAWHPTKPYLAVTVAEKNLVAFYEFTRDAEGAFGLKPWGQPVVVGKFPFHGKFSPDGEYFITTDLQWGSDVPGYLVGAGEGSLSVIKISTLPTGNHLDAMHQVVCSTPVGVSPECLAISPCGHYVATANLRRSMLPVSDPNMTGGSITLLSFDADTGMLSKLSETPIQAMPEGLTFDANGNYLVVSKFRSMEPDALDGELGFYKLIRGENATLRKVNYSVGTGVGPHGVVIVR